MPFVSSVFCFLPSSSFLFSLSASLFSFYLLLFFFFPSVFFDSFLLYSVFVFFFSLLLLSFFCVLLLLCSQWAFAIAAAGSIAEPPLDLDLDPLRLRFWGKFLGFELLAFVAGGGGGKDWVVRLFFFFPAFFFSLFTPLPHSLTPSLSPLPHSLSSLSPLPHSLTLSISLSPVSLLDFWISMIWISLCPIRHRHRLTL